MYMCDILVACHFGGVQNELLINMHICKWRASDVSSTSHTATHCNTLQHTATRCNTLQHIHMQVTCRMLHTATHCNTLQHTATHCNTLQHTATHCNTLQHMDAAHENSGHDILCPFIYVHTQHIVPIHISAPTMGTLCMNVWIGTICCMNVWMGTVCCRNVWMGTICMNVWIGTICCTYVWMGTICCMNWHNMLHNILCFFIYVIYLIHTCDATHLYVCYDWFKRVRHDSFTCATQLIHI